jgi:hypothetical protein
MLNSSPFLGDLDSPETDGQAEQYSGAMLVRRVFGHLKLSSFPSSRKIFFLFELFFRSVESQPRKFFFFFVPCRVNKVVEFF